MCKTSCGIKIESRLVDILMYDYLYWRQWIVACYVESLDKIEGVKTRSLHLLFCERLLAVKCKSSQSWTVSPLYCTVRPKRVDGCKV